jgi:hypothetical protein
VFVDELSNKRGPVLITARVPKTLSHQYQFFYNRNRTRNHTMLRIFFGANRIRPILTKKLGMKTNGHKKEKKSYSDELDILCEKLEIFP